MEGRVESVKRIRNNLFFIWTTYQVGSGKGKEKLVETSAEFSHEASIFRVHFGT